MSDKRPLLPTLEEMRTFQWSKEVCDKHHDLHLLAGVIVPEVRLRAECGDAMDGTPLYVHELVHRSGAKYIIRKFQLGQEWFDLALDLMEQDLNSATVVTGDHRPNHRKTILGDAWIVKPDECASDLLDRMYARIRNITSDEIMNGRCYL